MIIMLIIEFGSCYLKLELGLIKAQTLEMDESRSVMVLDRNLIVTFGFVPAPFLQALENWSCSFLKLGSPGYGPDRSQSRYTVSDEDLRAGTEE